MKKAVLICLCLLALPLCAMGAEAYIDGDGGYILSDANLFSDPMFENHQKEEAPQWFVGTNTTPSWNAKIPNPETLDNLIPLKGSSYIAEKETPRLFYYTTVNQKTYLSEGITSAARCFWNGSDSLLAFVKVEKGKTYYFSFECGFSSGKAPTVRVGAKDADKLCTKDGTLNLSEVGVTVGEVKKYERILTAEGDWFVFSACNLNRCEKACFTGFVLREARECSKESAQRMENVGKYITDYAPCAEEVTDSVGFIHPGITMTKQDLDRMQRHVRRGDEPWLQAFEEFASLSKCAQNPRIHYGDGSDVHDYVNVTYNDYTVGRLIRTDSDTCFAQTIMWYITGNDVYRENAMYILRQWSKMESLQAMNDEQLYFGTAMYKLAFSAEILRYTPYDKMPSLAWTKDDTAAFGHLLELTYDKYNRWWHFMNQHGINNMAFMASAIFRGDKEDFAAAVERTSVNSAYDNPRNGSIVSVIRNVAYRGQTNLQHCEMGRDQGHAYGDIGALSVCAMTAHRQNAKVDPQSGQLSNDADAVSLFEFADDRLLFGANYISKYNLGIDVPFLPVEVGEKKDAMWYYTINDTNRGLLYPNIGILYNFYKYELGWDMTDDAVKYLAKAYERTFPEGASEDFLGNSTLLFSGEDALGETARTVKEYSRDTKMRKQAETNTMEIISGSGEICDDGECGFLHVESDAVVSFATEDFYPAYERVTLRLRATAPTRIEIRNSSLLEEPFCVVEIPAAKDWINVTEPMGEREYWQRMTYFSFQTEGSVDLDYVEFSDQAAIASADVQYSRAYSDEERTYMYSGGQYVMAISTDEKFGVESTMDIMEFSDYLVVRPTKSGTQKIYISFNMGDEVRYICKEVFVFNSTKELIEKTTLNHKKGGSYTSGSMARFNMAEKKLLAVESKTSAEFVSCANELHEADLMNEVAFLPEEKSSEPIVWYDFDAVINSAVADKSPWGNDAKIHGATIASGEVLTGDGEYLSMPKGLLSSSDELSVFVRFTPQSELSDMFLWCIGNSSEEGYIFFNPSRPDAKARAAVTLSTYKNETAVEAAAFEIKQEQTALVTLGDGMLRLYVNGELACEEKCNITPDEIGGSQGFIGRSLFANDEYFKGSVSEFRVYNRVLSAEEALALHAREKEASLLEFISCKRDNSSFYYEAKHSRGELYAALYSGEGALLDVCGEDKGVLFGENGAYIKIFLWENLRPLGSVYKSVE